MKKLVLMIALVVGTTTFAQERKAVREEMSSENKIEKLTKELDLTDEQRAKAEAIFARKAEAMSVRKAENQAFDEEFRAILTPEQAEKHEAKKAEMKKEKEEKWEVKYDIPKTHGKKSK